MFSLFFDSSSLTNKSAAGETLGRSGESRYTHTVTRAAACVSSLQTPTSVNCLYRKKRKCAVEAQEKCKNVYEKERDEDDGDMELDDEDGDVSGDKTFELDEGLLFLHYFASLWSLC